MAEPLSQLSGKELEQLIAAESQRVGQYSLNDYLREQDRRSSKRLAVGSWIVLGAGILQTVAAVAQVWLAWLATTGG